MAKLLLGKELAKDIRASLKTEVDRIAELGISPGLAVILVGDDPASAVYVRSKEKACKELGIESRVMRLSEYISQKELIEIIDELNCDNSIDGILVQLPLPNHIDTDAIMDAISPEKDVDGIHAVSAGLLMGARPRYLACTPKGVMRILRQEGVALSGANAVVVGRSNIVGKPMAMMLLNENCTVTMCHSRTRDIKSFCKNADILVVAVGIPGFVKGDMVKPGAVVIDVGINRGEDNKLHGDVDFDSVEPVAGMITPVPGGVGPMTIAMLMENTVEAAKRHGNIK